MSFFGTILEKLGLGHKEEAKPAATAAGGVAGSVAKPVPAPAATPKPVVVPAAPKPAATPAPKPASTAGTPPPVSKIVAEDDARAEFGSQAQPVAAPKPAPVSEVDVVKKLEALGKGRGLNWKISIVDLLTLLEIDSSREARNELAKELGCPEDFMHDSAKMNTWLHKTVLKKIAENGGNIPAELLD